MTQELVARLDWRLRLSAAVESRRAETIILGLIIANAAILGLETTPFGAEHHDVLQTADRALLAAFVAELTAKMAIHGRRFFADPWRVFDFVVVAIALVPSAGPLAILRALRVLRVLRLITMVPAMRRVVGSLLGAIPGMGAIVAIMLLIFYVGSVIATKLFGPTFPDWFGSIGRSAYTLFQVMTLESWSMGIVRPVMEQHPFAWAFFVPYILIATFTMLNLFIAVIVNAMQTQAQAEAQHHDAIEHVAHDERSAILVELRALRQELATVRGRLEREGGGA